MALALGCGAVRVPASVGAAATAATRDVDVSDVARDHVAYTLAPVIEHGDVVALAVELRYHLDASGRSSLQLPERWASENELWRFVDDLRVDGAQIVATPSPAQRELQGPADAAVVVRYRVRSAYDAEPTAADGQPFAPIVRPRWFYAFGHALFAVPAERLEAEGGTVSFAWSGAPDGFGFASDLEQLDAHAGLPAMLDAVAMGGHELRVFAGTGADPSVRVAVLGAFDFDLPTFAALAREVITAERDFWDDHGAPFLVMLTAMLPAEGHQSLGGTGLGDGFSLIMGSDTPLPPVRHLLAHEYFHTWNPTRLGGTDPAVDEMVGKWFAEGFTEYYTWRLLLRAGIYTLEDFVAEWNAALIEYAASPVRTEPNARVLTDYWTNPDVGRLPYRRGPLLAALWQQRLHAATGGQRSLDDVLLRMRDRVREPSPTAAAPDASVLFPAVYRELGGPDLASDLARHVDRGEPIELPPDVFGDCVRVQTQEVTTRNGALVRAQQLVLEVGPDPRARASCVRTLAGG